MKPDQEARKEHIELAEVKSSHFTDQQPSSRSNILHWFERAHDRAMEIEGELDTRQTMDVTLSPKFGHGRPEV